jgi:hypothetical protein
VGFRDDEGALRARIDALDRELVDARRKVDALEGAGQERDRLRARVADLEAEIAKTRPKVSGDRRPRAAVGLLVGIGALAGVSIAFLALESGSSTPAPASLVPWGAGETLSPTAVPSLGMIDLDATPDPAPVRARAIGGAAAPGACRGSFAAAPQLVLRTAHPTATRIAPTAESGDLTLAIRLPDGRVLCDDDSGGSLNPLLSVVLPPGDTRVWVGPYSEGGELDARLVVHARRVDALPGDGAPTLGAVEGPGGAAHFEGTLSTVEPARQENPGCPGFLPIREQAVIRLRERAAVRIDASGESDLVLLVREPDGSVKCDDDSGPGSAPRIATILMPGEHHVLVGSYSQEETPIAFALDIATHAIDGDAAPTEGTHVVAPGGEEIRIDATSVGDLAPSALGAACAGGLVGAAPTLAIELGASQEVLVATAIAGAPFVVVQHPDRSFECVREAHLRSAWGAGVHRIYVGVADEDAPADFTMTIRAERSSVRPWSP